MTTRYLQNSQMGFYFTMGSPFSEDGDYDGDVNYMLQCLPAIKDALHALPCWKQTVEEANDIMQVQPYEFCEFEQQFEVIDDQVVFSFWVQSERLALFPLEDTTAMRDAIQSVTAASFVKAQSYQEWKESMFADVTL